MLRIQLIFRPDDVHSAQITVHTKVNPNQVLLKGITIYRSMRLRQYLSTEKKPLPWWKFHGKWGRFFDLSEYIHWGNFGLKQCIWELLPIWIGWIKKKLCTYKKMKEIWSQMSLIPKCLFLLFYLNQLDSTKLFMNNKSS